MLKVNHKFLDLEGRPNHINGSKETAFLHT